MACVMVMVSFTIKMEASMMESGSSIRCKALESYTINQENWPIKEVGQTINFQDEEFSITSIQQSYTKL